MGVNAGKRGVNTDGHPLPRQAGDRFLRAAGTHVGWLCWSTCSLTYMPGGTPVTRPEGHPLGLFRFRVPQTPARDHASILVGETTQKCPLPWSFPFSGTLDVFSGPKPDPRFAFDFFFGGLAGWVGGVGGGFTNQNLD